MGRPNTDEVTKGPHHSGTISPALLCYARRQYRALVTRPDGMLADDMACTALWVIMPNGIPVVVDAMEGAVRAAFEGDFTRLRNVFNNGGSRMELYFTAILERSATGYAIKCADMIGARALKRNLVGDRPRNHKKPRVGPHTQPEGVF